MIPVRTEPLVFHTRRWQQGTDHGPEHQTQRAEHYGLLMH